MDNKYANLPGIARNEPDVYETPNITNSNTNERVDPVEDDSSNVQKINISIKDVHDKFNTRHLNSDFADFSDTISNRRTFGYRVDPDNYEWDQQLVETPLQRFKRLEREFNELKNDLNQIGSTADASSSNEERKFDFDPIDLAKQVEHLQKNVYSLHLESIGAKVDVSQLDNKAKKQLLLDHLNELKKNLSQKEKSSGNANAPAKAESSIVFKLFADLEATDQQKNNKIAELTQRLSNLEKVFGAGNASVTERQISTLCGNIENKSILGLVENLNSKINLIDSQYLEQIESRLQLISQRVNQLNEKKGLIEDQEKLNRVNELYSMISKWKDISATVPAVVERLTALNELHQKAFQFPSILSRLDSEQQAIKERVDTSTDVLKQLKTSLESNLESIKKNFEVLNERVLSLNAKANA